MLWVYSSVNALYLYEVSIDIVILSGSFPQSHSCLVNCQTKDIVKLDINIIPQIQLFDQYVTLTMNQETESLQILIGLYRSRKE